MEANKRRRSSAPSLSGALALAQRLVLVVGAQGVNNAVCALLCSISYWRSGASSKRKRVPKPRRKGSANERADTQSWLAPQAVVNDTEAGPAPSAEGQRYNIHSRLCDTSWRTLMRRTRPKATDMPICGAQDQATKAMTTEGTNDTSQRE